MEILKLLSGSEIVAQVISFLVFFFLLKSLLWKRFLGILDERKDQVVLEFKKIEEMKKDAQNLKDAYEEKLKNAEIIGQAKIQKMVEDAHKTAENIKQEAQHQVLRLFEDNQALMAHEFSRAKEKLKDEIVDLVIETTEHVIEEKLTPEEDKKIVEKFLKDIDRLP